VKKKKSRYRSVLSWALWALLAQFILINISASLHAYKLTHLRDPGPDTWTKPASKNIFAKTWRLFSGATLYRQALTGMPSFPVSTVVLKTKSNIAVEAWYSRADSLAKGTIILFHGLMGHKGLIADEAEAFRSFGYNVMMVDVRDHGNSGGNVTTLGYKEAEEVKLAYDHILQTGEKNIFLWGASLGAVEIIKAVSDYQLRPSGIIVEIPFLSLQSHLEGRARTMGFPGQPFGFLTSFWIGVEQGFAGLSFRTANYAKNVHCPVLMQYSGNDELVLKYETNEIYEAIGTTSKKLILYDGAGHGSLLKNNPVTWNTEVKAFLND
ncbi:MAG TPA: alpha/beta hydrolase, partial [Chitinophagaceae bacterium]|nr:alpha/beta hydrolase [Chitinophagaceae bacterium]